MSDVYDNRFIPCYKCSYCGKIGKDSRENPIAYCLLKNVIVEPEIGCKESKLPKEAQND